MNGDIGVPWLLSPIWMALAGGFVPVLIAAFKRRGMTRWYLYGFACTLVAWPLLALPTIHALLVWRHDIPKLSPQRQRRADALALIAESSVRSYPSWIADQGANRPLELTGGTMPINTSARARHSSSSASPPIGATTTP